jgi:hypothetical protein
LKPPRITLDGQEVGAELFPRPLTQTTFVLRCEIRFIGIGTDQLQGVPEMDNGNLVGHVGQVSLGKLGVVGSDAPDLGNHSGHDVAQHG